MLNREFSAPAPNQKWVTDVTYLPFNQRFLYLSAIFDLYNNEIVAFRIGKHNNLKLVLDTVQAAVHKRKVKKLLLLSPENALLIHNGCYEKMDWTCSRMGTNHPPVIHPLRGAHQPLYHPLIILIEFTQNY